LCVMSKMNDYWNFVTENKKTSRRNAQQ